MANAKSRKPDEAQKRQKLRTQHDPTKGGELNEITCNHSAPVAKQRRHARNLLQNAESFFQEAVSYIERGEERDWVFAIVNLAIALELTLKAVLQSEHWTIVFEDISAASEEAFQSGDFRS